VGQDLTATANGSISDAGNVVVGGLTTLAAGAGNDITLNDADDFGGTLRIVSGNNVTLNDVNGITFGSSAVSGTLDVTAGGNISQSGALMAAGLATFNVTAGSDVILNDLNNDLTSVSVPGVFLDADNKPTPNAEDVTLSDKNGFTLGAIRSAGTLTLNTDTGAGDVTQLLGSTVEADTLKGTLGGGLVLGNPADPANQPANNFVEIGAINHVNSSASVNDGLLYIYDFGNQSYQEAGVPNPVPSNGNVPLGLTINGVVSGSGNTVIRTVGDLVLAESVGRVISDAGSGNNIELSAEPGANFHNLFGANAVVAGGGVQNPLSRFVIYSTAYAKNFGFNPGAFTPSGTINTTEMSFNGLKANNGASNKSFGDAGIPSSGNIFAFSAPQNLINSGDEAGKFFAVNLLAIVTGSVADALTNARDIPTATPPTVFTSTYHLYQEEEQQKEEEEEEKKKGKPLTQLSPLWEANRGGQ
jgi:hypothetical protein